MPGYLTFTHLLKVIKSIYQTHNLPQKDYRFPKAHVISKICYQTQYPIREYSYFKTAVNNSPEIIVILMENKLQFNWKT